MTKELWKTYKQALTSTGVPEDLAEKAAKVIANDQPGIPNMGRSPEDQQAVMDAWLSSSGCQSRELADE